MSRKTAKLRTGDVTGAVYRASLARQIAEIAVSLDETVVVFNLEETILVHNRQDNLPENMFSIQYPFHLQEEYSCRENPHA